MLVADLAGAAAWPRITRVVEAEAAGLEVDWLRLVVAEDKKELLESAAELISCNTISDLQSNYLVISQGSEDKKWYSISYNIHHKIKRKQY